MKRAFSDRALRVFLATACCFALGACAGSQTSGLGQVAVGTAWQGMSKATAKNPGVITAADAVDMRWWMVFHDTTLDRLVDRALNGSHLLSMAEARLAEAAGNADLAGAVLYPQIDATAGVSRVRDADGRGGLETVKRAGLQGTFEADLAGVNRARRTAARAAYESARAARDNVRINLIADVSVAYVRLRGAQAQLALARENLDAQSSTLRVTEDQRDEGAVSDFEVARSAAQTATTSARLTQLDTAVTTAINDIHVLCGEVPGNMNAMLAPVAPIPALPVQTVIAMPVGVLAQRPDIQIAEHDLAQAAALKQAASREVFPTLSLSAFFGFEDSSLSSGFSPWNAAANAVAPLLHFGRIQARIDTASARETMAFHNYRQTTIAAVANVENTLTAYLNEQKRIGELSVAVRQQTRAAEIVDERFRLGKAEQTDLLLSEEDRLDAALALAGAKAQAAENLVNLYRAMGWGASASNPDMKVMQGHALQTGPAQTKPDLKAGMKPIVDE